MNLNHLESDQILDFYRALKEFTNIIEDKSNHIWIGLKPDQVIIFDNFRLLHGRSSFQGDRQLITTYMPRDEWRSKAFLLGAF